MEQKTCKINNAELSSLSSSYIWSTQLSTAHSMQHVSTFLKVKTHCIKWYVLQCVDCLCT